MVDKPEKLSPGRKAAFACGDVFGGGAFNILNFLYPAYAALTLGLGASLTGIIVMLSKIWDAVTDPFMGLISDGTRSRMGKRRVYILAGAPLVLVSMVLLFFPWNISSTALRFIAALLSYMFFATVETMVMIPYYSLSSEISSDYTERAKANTLRIGFSVASSIVCVVVPNLIVNAVGQPSGYIVMSVAFGLLFALTLTVTALWAKEEVVSPPVRA
ncbi:MAG TPA: MFS transporter, partial [Firmicutes bacterium]|nr:MFS transporter [Bacillota bacterium]